MTAHKCRGGIALLVALICICATHCHHLTDDFALELLDGTGILVAKEIAKKHEFELLHHSPQLGNVYHMRHKSSCKSHHSLAECAADSAALTKSVAAHPRVLRAVHQSLEEVEKKWLPLPSDDEEELDAAEEKMMKLDEEEEDVQAYKKALSQRKLLLKFNDPHFKLQWYLHNIGQISGINPGLDLNVLSAWNKGFAGTGVVVTVVDDGLDVKNPDLTRYDPLASADLNNLTNVAGLPIRYGKLTSAQTHGTACAGEIGAAANNRFCGIGVAFNSSLGGIRMLDGPVTDLLEAYSILHNNQYISIYSCSWGPKDNGWKMDMPKIYTSRALNLGTAKGRGGKGSIFVMASGNGGQHGDNCGADGFVNSPHTVAVAALNIYGRTPMYGESCSAIHVAAPVGGRDSKKSKRPNPQVTTTTVNGGCYNAMSGTSAATPLVSACLALALEANPSLTWRDIQHLLARSARLPSARGGPWQVNGAGHYVSHHAGFGLLDCARLVFNAQTWPGISAQVVCDDAKPYRGRFRVPLGKPLTLPFVTGGCNGKLTRMEHALVTVTMVGMRRRGNIELWLESPSGTKARLLGPRPKDADSKLGIRAQTFLSLLSWDENPKGRWLLRVRDRGDGHGGPRAVVTSASLRLMGSGGGPAPPVIGAGTPGRARWLSPAETSAAFRRQRLEAAGQQVLHPSLAGLSRRLGDALRGSGGGDGSTLSLAGIVDEARQVVAKGDVTEWDLNYLLRQIDSALL